MAFDLSKPQWKKNKIALNFCNENALHIMRKARKYYRLSYLDLRDGKRKYYLRTGFDTVEEAENEHRKMNQERNRKISSHRFFMRVEWAVVSIENKEVTFVKYL